MTNSSTNNLISHDIENSPSKTPIKTNWPRKFLPFIEALSFGKWSKIQIHQTWVKKDDKSKKKQFNLSCKKTSPLKKSNPDCLA